MQLEEGSHLLKVHGLGGEKNGKLPGIEDDGRKQIDEEELLVKLQNMRILTLAYEQHQYPAAKPLQHREKEKKNTNHMIVVNKIVSISFFHSVKLLGSSRSTTI